MTEVPRVTLADIEAAAELLARGRHPHPDGGLALAVRPGRRAGRPQVREPPAHRLLQDPRRLRPDLPALRGGAGPRRRGGVGRQPRPGRRAGRPAARHQGHRLHARGGADPQGEGHPGVRRRRGLPRPLPRGRAGRGPGVRRGDRRGADPPLRPRRHRGRAGHRRPGDPRAGARRRRPCSCPPAAAGCWPGSRSRSRRRGPTCASSACRPRVPRPTPRSLEAGAPGPLDVDDDDGRRHRRRAARGRSRSPPSATYVDEIVTVSEESLSRALLALLERAKMVVEPAGAAAVAAMLDDPTAFETPAVAVLSGGNIDPLLLGKVIRHGMAAAGRYLYLRVLHPRPARRPRQAARRGRRGRRATSSRSPTSGSRRRCTSTRSRCGSSWRPAASRTPSRCSPGCASAATASSSDRRGVPAHSRDGGQDARMRRAWRQAVEGHRVDDLDRCSCRWAR